MSTTEVEVAARRTLLDWLIHQIWFIPGLTLISFAWIYLMGWLGLLPGDFVNDLFKYASALIPL